MTALPRTAPLLHNGRPKMRYLDVNGARLFVTDTGEPPSGETGTPILFIHGLMLASESWRAQVAHFAPTHRVITFDLRGQGLSDKPRLGLGLDALAEDAVEVLTQLGIEAAHVVGFSMGSFIAMRLAARHPDLVRSLTLVGPSADAEEASNLPRYRLLIAIVRLFGPRVVTGAMLKILFGKTFLADPAVRAEREHWRGILRRLPRSLHRAAAASAGRAAIHDLLPLIKAPTLIFSGSEDRPISPASAARVRDGIRGAQVVPVPGAGHAVMIERAETFNTVLRLFLQDHDGRQDRPDQPTRNPAARGTH
ncbi:MAG: hypothetical protein B7Z10_02865 [Rhodobacterales bacterium 32-66-7]|nr:MAG: hypothetical protein B7Z10_02865 [Rhodobacterales bacterium 32-66-7]